MPTSPNMLHTLSTCASRPLEQRGQQLARELDVRQQIHAQQRSQCSADICVGLAVVRDAGVVHEDIDAAPAAENLGHGRRNLARLADVAPAADHFDARPSRTRRRRVGQARLRRCRPGTDCTPSAASRSAIARPMPEAAPVTSAVLPRMSRIGDSLAMQKSRRPSRRLVYASVSELAVSEL